MKDNYWYYYRNKGIRYLRLLNPLFLSKRFSRFIRYTYDIERARVFNDAFLGEEDGSIFNGSNRSW